MLPSCSSGYSPDLKRLWPPKRRNALVRLNAAWETEEATVIDKILQDLIERVKGSRAVIFLDGDGEAIAQAGSQAVDLKLLGAWKEIHFGHIREITERLGLGSVKAVLFSLEEGNELIVPVGGEYCLLLFLSSFASPQEALEHLAVAVQQLQKDIE